MQNSPNKRGYSSFGAKLHKATCALCEPVRNQNKEEKQKQLITVSFLYLSFLHA